LLLVVLPLWMSILVRTYSWMAILGRNGIANSLLEALRLSDGPIQLLYTRFSLYVGTVHIMLPFMILPIFNSIRQTEPRLIPAARSLGASPISAFFLVFFPLSLPGLAAGSSLVFILSLGFFVTPALLGGDRDTTFVMLIERTVNALRDWPQASAMSVVLLALTFVLVALTQRQLGTETGPRPALRSGNRVFRILLGAFDLLRALMPVGLLPLASDDRSSRDRPGIVASLIGYSVLLFLTLPILVVLLLAFSSAPFLTFPPPGFSLHWFNNFFTRPDWIAASLTSLKAASLTMVIATLSGLGAAIALVRGRLPLTGLITAFLISPLVVPTVILAIALYFVFVELKIVGTLFGLVLAHVVLAIPYVIIVMSGALRGIDTSLERAAQTLGASPVNAFMRITLPVIRPALLTAAFFAFLASFDELVIALFISGTGSKTLPKRMWEGIREEIDPTIAAVAALLIMVSVVLLFASELARLRSRRRTERLVAAIGTTDAVIEGRAE
jgi:putative spermidine/putrescine transport system permease protein